MQPILCDKHLGKIIYNCAMSTSGSYCSWMRPYITGREFYSIKEFANDFRSIENIKDRYLSTLSYLHIEGNEKDFWYGLRRINKFNMITLITRCHLSKSSKVSTISSSILRFLVLESRISASPVLSLSRAFNLSNMPSAICNVHVMAPVCPDYSYKELDDNTYRYTFESVNGGIGLVAKRAIRNINELQRMVSDLRNPKFVIDFSILVGDFEASPGNCSRLSETEESFLAKVDSTISCIKSTCPSCFVGRFTDLCGGLEAWRSLQKINSKLLSINSFGTLTKNLPSINHERIFISRLPLYKMWFGDKYDYTQAFTMQTIEYISMGDLISRYGNGKCFTLLLASDHRAMRPYYNIFGNHAACGSTISY